MAIGATKIDNNGARNTPVPALVPIVEIHGWEHQHVEHDFTKYTKAARWSHSVKAPWGNASVQMVFPASEWEAYQEDAYRRANKNNPDRNSEIAQLEAISQNIEDTPKRLALSMPTVGDFLVIREPQTRRTLWWGPIRRVEFTQASVENGTLKTVSFSVSCVNWMSRLNDCHMAVGLGLDSSKDNGTLVDSGSIDDLLAAISDSLSSDPGDAFIRMWQFIRGYKLPQSLGGSASVEQGSIINSPASYISNHIAAITDRQRAFQFARGRIVEPIPGSGNFKAIAGMSTVLGSQTNLLQLLTSSFMINQDLVEIFPSLEYPGSSEALTASEVGPEVVEGLDTKTTELDSIIEGSESPVFADALDAAIMDSASEYSKFYQFKGSTKFAKRFPFPYARPEDQAPDSAKQKTLSTLIGGAGVYGTNNLTTDYYRFLTQQMTDSTSSGADATLAAESPKAYVEKKLSWVEELSKDLISPLAHKLLANPVIIYRMAPLRSVPMAQIAEQLSKKVSFRLLDGVTWYNDISKHSMTDDLKHTVDGVTRYRDPYYFVGEDEVISVSGVKDEGNLYNTFTADISYGSAPQLRFWADAGLPFQVQTEVEKHGTRLYTTDWSLLPKKLKDSHDENILTYMRTIVAHAAHVLGRRHEMMNGTVAMAYRPDIQHGEPIRVQLPQSFPGFRKTSSNTSLTDAVNREIKDVSQFPEDLYLPPGYDPLTIKASKKFKQAATTRPQLDAYVEAVRHTCEALPSGEIKMRTFVDYSYGAFDPETRQVALAEY